MFLAFAVSSCLRPSNHRRLARGVIRGVFVHRKKTFATPFDLQVLLCDEPTSGLDSAAATNIVAMTLVSIVPQKILARASAAKQSGFRVLLTASVLRPS